MTVEVVNGWLLMVDDEHPPSNGGARGNARRTFGRFIDRGGVAGRGGADQLISMEQAASIGYFKDDK